MDAEILDRLRREASLRMWEKGVVLVSAFAGIVLSAYGNWTAAAPAWAVFVVLLTVAGVRSVRAERAAIEHTRSRASDLTPAQRAVELATIEHYTHGDFGSLSFRVRRLRQELEELAGGVDSAAVHRHRESLAGL